MLRDAQVQNLIEYGEDLGVDEDEVMDAVVSENFCPCDDCYEAVIGKINAIAEAGRQAALKTRAGL